MSNRIDASFLRGSTHYGRFKASGWGHENGIDTLGPYRETRTTVISSTGKFPNFYEN
ncbi:hypothetical protein [Burkholderia lata]|uniref:hypothetical protein n=1 Tax=Burkholderia lata (strain ATCC 17760 / DSM 23089 / LMG 22485 / NCIMB 9086 / R18194 / 383) TaxID=482957 RepID=UPI0020C69D9E|nr:hypothetical protein [Burkholderia lata]